MNTKPKNTDIHAALKQRHAHEPKLPDGFEERVVKLAKEQAEMPTPDDHRGEETEIASHQRFSTLRRIAAIFLGLVLVGGLTLAAVRLLNRPQPPLPSHPDYADMAASTTADSIVSFDNQQLDQLLNVVATHYAHAVVFADDSLRQLRITTTWNSHEPLAAFLESLNELNGLILNEKDDTIYVEQKGGKEDKE
ncbi:MAG: DUF4974 domain-containing protein [Prevotella sp.]|nr:DUF4974 domain-containing protein [Prevotella sp.]